MACIDPAFGSNPTAFIYKALLASIKVLIAAFLALGEALGSFIIFNKSSLVPPSSAIAASSNIVASSISAKSKSAVSGVDLAFWAIICFSLLIASKLLLIKVGLASTPIPKSVSKSKPKSPICCWKSSHFVSSLIILVSFNPISCNILSLVLANCITSELLAWFNKSNSLASQNPGSPPGIK